MNLQTPEYVTGHGLITGKSVLVTAAAGAGIGFSAATRAVEEGARGIVWTATLPADGPSGGFFRHGERIVW